MWEPHFYWRSAGLLCKFDSWRLPQEPQFWNESITEMWHSLQEISASSPETQQRLGQQPGWEMWPDLKIWGKKLGKSFIKLPEAGFLTSICSTSTSSPLPQPTRRSPLLVRSTRQVTPPLNLPELLDWPFLGFLKLIYHVSVIPILNLPNTCWN